jgi:hypothetical protein
MRTFIAAAALAAATAVGGMAAVPAVSGASARTEGRPAVCGVSRSARGLEVVGLAGDRLVCFRADRPSRERDIGRVRGLRQDTTLVGIDDRPANGVLYGVGDQDGVYTVDVTNARVTLAVRSTVPLRGMTFGVDFNPAADRCADCPTPDPTTRWTVPLGGQANAARLAPVVGGDVVYAAVRTPSGERIMAASTDPCGTLTCPALASVAVTGTPTALSVSGGRVFVSSAGGTGGRLTALGLPA